MELQVEGRHFKVTQTIQTHIEEKLQKLEKYFDGIHRMHAILEVEKRAELNLVELVCTVARRQTLIAKGSDQNMYVAIDKAEKKMLSEMKKFKDRLHSTVRGKTAKIKAAERAEVATETEE